MNEEYAKQFIVKELSNFKFQQYTKGFKYLVEVIYLSIINENALDNLSKNVFPIVAEKYKEKSFFNVKWCIDKVIETMYNNTDMEILCNYFHLDYNIKPSLKFIVYTIVCNYNNSLK